MGKMCDQYGRRARFGHANDFGSKILIQGFGSAFFFCGSGSRQKTSCGFGSGSWGYPGEGAGGKGKK